jgi:hypothetical protein
METMNMTQRYIEVNGTSYHKDTDQRVIDVLDVLRRDGQNTRIRIYLGDTKTGESWLEEYGTMGYVGRSAGRIKVPILLSNTRSRGGAEISTQSIVKITDTRGRVFYEHPTFFVRDMYIMDMREVDESAVTHGQPWRVTTTDDVLGHFASEGEAGRYIAFLKGTRFSKGTRVSG